MKCPKCGSDVEMMDSINMDKIELMIQRGDAVGKKIEKLVKKIILERDDNLVFMRSLCPIGNSTEMDRQMVRIK